MNKLVGIQTCTILWAVVLCLALGTGAKAQSMRGGLAGNILDKTGAAVAGASIVATNQGTGDVSKGVSTSSGSYRFPELPLGKYDVTVSMPGFTTRVYTGVLIQVQEVTSLNLTLAAGATDTITVSADAPAVEAQTSDVGGVITSKQLIDLPLAITEGVGQLRSPEAFMFLIPGTAGPGTANNAGGIYLNKVAGGQNYGNEVLLDGASVQRSENGSSFDQEAPSVEALDQFKVTTSLPQAEYGRTTGGIENFATKSGTSHFHGTVFDILRNNRMDSNGWFAGGREATLCVGASDTPACKQTYARPVDTKNDYGISLGGPVRIPHLYNGNGKLFFFFSWEQVHYALGSLATTTVPTDAEKTGDFSNIAIYNPASNPVGTNPCDGKPVYNGEIFDPSTTRTVPFGAGTTECREPFAGNKISSPLSTSALKLLSLFPEAQNQNLVTQNYSFKGLDIYNNTTYSIRVDADLSERNKVFASYNTRQNTIPSGGAPILPDPIDPNHWTQNFITHFARVGWDFTLTPRLLNHLILGYNRSNSINLAPAITSGTNWSQALGITGFSSHNLPVTSNGFTDTEGIAQNADNIDNGVRLGDSIRWEKGRNSFAFGVDIRWQQYSPLDQNSPALSFSASQTAGSPSLTGTGNGLASELLGEVNDATQTNYLHQSRWTSWYDGFYAQDDLKLTHDLILNLGLRYDLDLPRKEADNDTSNFSPTALDPEYGVPGALIFGTKCNCNTSWANAYHKEISPRVGFAYAPTSLQGKTAFRGGAAILYGPLQYSDFGGSMVTGYQTSQNAQSLNGFDPSFQLNSGFPGFAAPPDLDPGFFNGRPVTGSYIMSQYGRPASIYEWNLQVQQEMAKDLILTLGYIGSEAQNLHSNLENINNIPLADLNYGPQLSENLNGNTLGVASPFANYYGLWGNNVTVQQALRPFPQYDYIDSGCCLQNVGHSSYNALIASLQRKFRGGLTFQASYTWEKTLTDSDSLLPNNGVGVAQDQNVDNLHESKSISAQDIPQTFVVNYLYQLPFGKGRRYLHGTLENYILGGWEVGGVQRYQSGQPESFCCQAGIPGFEQSIRFRRIATAPIKSAIYSKGSKALNPFNTQFGSDPTINSLYNGSTVNYSTNPNGAALRAMAAFDPTVRDANMAYSNSGGKTIEAYVLGNTPRVTGEVRTPTYFDEDFSVLKQIPIRSGVNFIFKFEIFNTFNRHTFTLPDQAPTDLLFGVPTGTIQGTSGAAQRAGQATARIAF